MSSKVKSEVSSPRSNGELDPSAGFADDEDTGELNLDNVVKNAWMTRLPPSLWKALGSMADDEPVEVGHMRVWEEGNKIKEVRLRFRENIKQLAEEPKQYHLSTTNEKPSNLYVFSEKDSGDFKPVTSFATYKIEKQSGSKDNRKGRFRGRMLRKAIPKNTSLVSVIQKETNCHPVMNQELRKLRDSRLLTLVAAETAKATPIGGTGVHMAMVGPSTTHGFIKPVAPAKGSKVQENKFTRMPQEQLLDEIGKCFQKFKYWRLKSLQQTLRQPEAYLKETLLKIAELVKTGPFANTWTLTAAMSRTLMGTDKEEAAPEDEEPKDDDGSEDVSDDDGEE